MADTNFVVVAGRLTKDPELKSTGAGAHFCRFSIANNYLIKQGNEWVSKANFFDAVAWGKQAESIYKHFSKGQKILVIGTLRWSSWEHENKKHSRVEIIVNSFSALESATEHAAGTVVVPDEDIPF